MDINLTLLKPGNVISGFFHLLNNFMIICTMKYVTFLGNDQRIHMMKKSLNSPINNYQSAPEWKHFFRSISSGFALGEIIQSKTGEPVDFRFLAMNKACEKMMGLEAEGTIGKAGRELGAFQDKALIQTFAKVVLNGRTVKADYYHRDLKRTFELEIFNPEKGKFAMIINDISERKEAEEALRDSEIRYHRLFEAAKDGILILDAESGKVVDVNPFLIELLGITFDDISGKELWELGFFKDIASNKARFLELQKKKYVRYENLPMEKVDGSKLNVEFISNVYLVNRRRVIQCNIRDITERRKTEEVLKKGKSHARRKICVNATRILSDLIKSRWDANYA